MNRRIALFITCLGEALSLESGPATIEVLERLGHEVVFRADQTCRGQTHLNSVVLVVTEESQ